MSVEVRRTAASDPVALGLIAAMVDEMGGLYERGLGSQLLAALEQLARDLGYAVVRLDTGPRQPEVRRMYERAGYVPVPDYNGNPYASFWGEKRL